MLNRNSSKPLNEQLVDLLKEELIRYSVGDKFLTDRQLCRQYEVSLPVVRKAISTLVQEELLERVPPKGTFVRNQKSHTNNREKLRIGIVCPLQPFLPHINAIRGIQRVIERTQHETTLIENLDRAMPDSAIITEVIQKKMNVLDGFIWISTVQAELKPASFLRDMSRKIVLLNARVKSGELTSVMTDFEEAEYRLTNHLIEQGAQNIAYLGGPEYRIAAQSRYSGFCQAMNDASLPLNSDIVIPFSDLDRNEMVKKELLPRLQKTKTPIDAIICYNDYLAQQAIEDLKAMDKKIPEDIMIAGFDGSQVAATNIPSITTCQIPYEEMGSIAADILLNQLTSNTPVGVKQTIPCPLIIRKSSGGGE